MNNSINSTATRFIFIFCLQFLHNLEIRVMKLGLMRQLGDIRLNISRGRKLVEMIGVLLQACIVLKYVL